MSDPVYALVVAPHPDDAEFGVSGTVAHWTSQGKDVVYVLCTNGNKGTNDRSINSDELATVRRQEQCDAAGVLNVREVVFLDLPDQALEDTPEFRKMLVKEIRKFQPTVVVTSDPYRRYIWHRDHRITGQVALDAVFPYARDHLSYPDLLEQGLEPHKVRELWFWGSEDINYRVDITPTFDKKIAALLCHQSQVGHRTKQDLESRLIKRYKELAKEEPFDLAEAFHRVQIPY